MTVNYFYIVNLHSAAPKGKARGALIRDAFLTCINGLYVKEITFRMPFLMSDILPDIPVKAAKKENLLAG